MNTHEHDLDTILTRLIAGESADTVAHDFPELRSEVIAHAKLLTASAQLKQMNPHVSGLHTALQSVRTVPMRNAPTPSPFAFVQFSKYSLTYKQVLVLPVLLVALVASGAYLFPQLGVVGPSGTLTDNTGISQSADDAQPTAFSESVSAPRGSAMMKTMALAPAAQPELPQDTTLAAIYGPELTHDVQAVQEDSVQATSIADDTTDTEGYTNAYDENDF
jgi:hypothetical protein